MILNLKINLNNVKLNKYLNNIKYLINNFDK